MKRNPAQILWQAMPLIDVLLIVAMFRAAHWLRYDIGVGRAVGEFYAPFQSYWLYVGVFAFWFLFTASLNNLYRQERGRTWLAESVKIINSATNAALVFMALSFALQPLVFSRLMLIIGTALVVAGLVVARVVFRVVRQQLRLRGIGVERVLLVGAGEVGRAVLSSIIARPALGYVPIGYLDDDPDRGGVDMGRVRGLGGMENLSPLLDQHACDLVIVALPWDARQRIMEIVSRCEQRGIASRVVPDIFQLNMSQVQIENLEGIPLLGLKSEPRMTPTKHLIKRALDLIIITLASPFILLLTGLVALAIKLDSPGPVFYRQKRLGKDGHEFYVYKFRSMVVDADQKRNELIRETGADPRRPKWRNDPRITRVGRFLRRTSMDELPNLINVLRGEMSLVGPRPPMPEEVKLYEPWMHQRLNTQPGLTCLWQVSGRSNIPFEEQVLLDIYYIENWSLGLELQILLRTIPQVLLGTGAY
ncbi:MAG: sugar transferase [Anaerolineae bacterium]|nr:sugar transferase [Anaerolineae bacterium]